MTRLSQAPDRLNIMAAGHRPMSERAWAPAVFWAGCPIDKYFSERNQSSSAILAIGCFAVNQEQPGLK
jgi:hypothetical protein